MGEFELYKDKAGKSIKPLVAPVGPRAITCVTGSLAIPGKPGEQTARARVKFRARPIGDPADFGQAIAVGGSTGVRLFAIVGGRTWKVDDIGQVNALAVVGADGGWVAVAAGKTARLLRSADKQIRWPANTHPHTITPPRGKLGRSSSPLDAPTASPAASTPARGPTSLGGGGPTAGELRSGPTRRGGTATGI